MTKPLFAAVALCLTSLSAQQPGAAPAAAVDPARFIPADYRNLLHVDVAALRDAGLLDALLAGEMKQMLPGWEQSFGGTLSQIDHATIVIAVPSERSRVPYMLQVLRCNSPLGMPAHFADLPDSRIGEFTVRRMADLQMRLQPQPNLVVLGTPAMLEPLLEKADHRGGPCPDVQSLSAGAEPSLMSMIYEFVGDVRRGMSRSMFPGVAWPENDAPQWISVRVLQGGEKGGPKHVFIEGVVRHREAGEGMKVSEAAVTEALARFVDAPDMAALKPVLATAKINRRAGDVVLRADLGAQKEAAPLLGLVFTALAQPRTIEGRAVRVKAAAPAAGAAPAAEPPVAPPPPPPPAPTPPREQPPR